MSRAPNPDLMPETAFVDVAEDRLKIEQAVTDNYRAFSSEILRLSLLGIAVIGFIYEKLLGVLDSGSKHLAAFSLIFFGIAAGSAIIHRYFNGETTRLYVWGWRFHAVGRHDESLRCLKARESVLIVCIMAKAVSAICLGVGAMFLAVAFTRGLW